MRTLSTRGVLSQGGGAPTSPVTFRSSAETAQSSLATWTVNAPSGVQADDLLLMGITRSSASGADPTISGWTKIANQDGSNQVAGFLYYKVAGSSEPSTYSIGWGGIGRWGVVTIAAYYGQDVAAPIQSSGVLDGGATAGTSCFTPSGLSATGSGVLACHFLIGNTAASGNPTFTWPSPTTERVDYFASTSGKTSVTLGEEAVAAGSVAQRTVTCAINTYYASITALIAPA